MIYSLIGHRTPYRGLTVPPPFPNVEIKFLYYSLLRHQAGGQKKVIKTANRHCYCSSYNFFVNASACPINVEFPHKIILGFLSSFNYYEKKRAVVEPGVKDSAIRTDN